MTTIEIFKRAKIDAINKPLKAITATGVDTITGRVERRTFHYISERVLDEAERYVGKRDSSLTIQVDSGTKSIDLRDDSNDYKLEDGEEKEEEGHRSTPPVS
jgi:hypothetical protein